MPRNPIKGVTDKYDAKLSLKLSTASGVVNWPKNVLGLSETILTSSRLAGSLNIWLMANQMEWVKCWLRKEVFKDLS